MEGRLVDFDWTTLASVSSSEVLNLDRTHVRLTLSIEPMDEKNKTEDAGAVRLPTRVTAIEMDREQLLRTIEKLEDVAKEMRGAQDALRVLRGADA